MRSTHSSSAIPAAPVTGPEISMSTIANTGSTEQSSIISATKGKKEKDKQGFIIKNCNFIVIFAVQLKRTI